jgi:hypothetical protein
MFVMMSSGLMVTANAGPMARAWGLTTATLAAPVHGQRASRIF